MNFSRADSDGVRQQIRDLIAECLTPDVRERTAATGSEHDREFYRALAEGGWLSAAWPAEVGGRDMSLWDQAAVMEELQLAAAPVSALSTTGIVAWTILQVGTDDQRRSYLPAIARGELIIALGYSEPDSGSDLASVRTSARLDGDHWVINGQKQFTTSAENATHVFLLARTARDDKHGGLTTFLVPTSARGFGLTPIETLGGERTNCTFYNDVVIPDKARIGDVGGGWSVMAVALPAERLPVGLGHMQRIYDEVSQLVGELHDELPPGRLHLFRCRLAELAIAIEQTRLLGAASISVNEAGRAPLVEGSMAKLFGSEAVTRAAEDFFDLLGDRALDVLPGHPPGGTSWTELAYRYCPILTIAGGTSEIQRGIVARHGLGLTVR